MHTYTLEYYAALRCIYSNICELLKHLLTKYYLCKRNTHESLYKDMFIFKDINQTREITSANVMWALTLTERR